MEASVQPAAGEDWSPAEKAARKSLEEAQNADDARGAAAAKGTIALLVARRDPVEGDRLIEEAIALARAADAPELLAGLLVDSGSLRATQRRYSEALTRFVEAHEIALTAGLSRAAAEASTNAARACLDSDIPEQSIAYLKQGMAEADDLSEGAPRALVQVNLGRVAERLRDKGHGDQAELLRSAHAAYSGALTAANAVDDSRTASFALGRLAALYAEEGRHAEAIGLTRRAIMRSEIGNHSELTWQWRAQLGGWLAEQGERENAINELRAAVGGAEAMKAFGAIDQALGTAYLMLVDLVLARAAEQTNPEARELDLRMAQNTLEQLKSAELRDYFRDECVEAYAARNQDPSRVSPHALVIYPVLLPDRLVLLLSGPGFIRQEVVDVPGEQVAQTSRELRRFATKLMTRQYKRPAGQLYSWLVAPASHVIEEMQAETLVFVPSGPLLATPFAALWDGEQFLVEQKSIAVIPGLALTDPRPLARRDLRVLVGGLSESVQGFSELPSVAGEVAALHEMYDGDVLLNENFSTARIEDQIDEEPFDIVHIASHAQFDAEREETFVLTYDDRISMNELSSLIGRLQFRDRPLELLTLSACETAAGDDRAALGLVGVAVKAGARSALGTLWSVNDAASAKLVDAFYRSLKESGISRAEALRRAQRELIKDPAFSHPSYWSAFILVSNWL